MTALCYLRTAIDQIIRIDREYMLVTGVSTDTLTVTRGYASSTVATHTTGAVVHLVNQPEYEGADAKKAIARVRTRPSNYIQTFTRTIASFRRAGSDQKTWRDNIRNRLSDHGSNETVSP